MVVDLGLNSWIRNQQGIDPDTILLYLFRSPLLEQMYISISVSEFPLKITAENKIVT